MPARQKPLRFGEWPIPQVGSAGQAHAMARESNPCFQVGKAQGNQEPPRGALECDVQATVERGATIELVVPQRAPASPVLNRSFSAPKQGRPTTRGRCSARNANIEIVGDLGVVSAQAFERMGEIAEQLAFEPQAMPVMDQSISSGLAARSRSRGRAAGRRTA